MGPNGAWYPHEQPDVRPGATRNQVQPANGELLEPLPVDDRLGPEERDPFFQLILSALMRSGIPHMVGGAYALERYTGVVRRTKDLDVFIRRQDCSAVLATLARAGCGTELTDSRWIAKAFRGDHFIDIIFNSGNGLCPVDDGWLEYAVRDLVVGLPVRLCPAEEIIWQKIFIMERERFDGADVAHLLHARGPKLDWHRLLRRVGDHWEVLLAHLILFHYIYPGDAAAVPAWVEEELIERASAAPSQADAERLCQGTLLSRYQYMVDIASWGYEDARLAVPVLDAA